MKNSLNQALEIYDNLLLFIQNELTIRVHMKYYQKKRKNRLKLRRCVIFYNVYIFSLNNQDQSSGMLFNKYFQSISTTTKIWSNYRRTAIAWVIIIFSDPSRWNKTLYDKKLQWITWESILKFITFFEKICFIS